MKSEHQIRKEVLRMAEDHSPANIASALGVPFEDVMEFLEEGNTPQTPVTVMCHKTKRVFHFRSFRMAYRQICIRGLTDWTWHLTRDYNAWLEANA
ncbi:hypothetical protein [Leisingera daeponensis]|uniref:hypothetical protein n=1 Tax=Leisingera daeponensis TaxID=405746 RepID=UPI001C93D91C|nr:hypothetical protein [Leisingera daeponensis]MBY6055398.1 hypothetical protein [Leisingera daeponensis]